MCCVPASGSSSSGYTYTCVPASSSSSSGYAYNCVPRIHKFFKQRLLAGEQLFQRLVLILGRLRPTPQ